MIETMARLALPSHEGPAFITPAFTSVQFTTLNVGSRIHIHATVLRMVGTMKGRSRNARARFFPRKCWCITSAIARPPASFSSVATIV